MAHHRGMVLYRTAFAAICLAVVALFGWLFRRAYREGRMEYGNFFGRRLYVYRDRHPRLFWLAFAPGLLFCVGLIDLAFRGPTAIGF